MPRGAVARRLGADFMLPLITRPLLPRRLAMPMALLLLAPPRILRVGASLLAMLLVINVLWHGSRPYAVGLLPGGWDKVAHASLHAVLCTMLLFCLGIRRGRWAVVLCAAFAAIDEFSQLFTPGRSVSALDWLASVAGALLALGAAHLLVAPGSVACAPSTHEMNH